MTNHTLRSATAADLPEIMRLERAGFAASIQESESTFADRIRTFPQGCLVLARDDGKLSGYLCAELWPYTPDVFQQRFARDHSAAATHDPDGAEIYISSMVIDPACRGSGLAKRLFSESLAYIRNHFPIVRSAILIVHPEWLAARKVYVSNGFQEAETVAGYFATPAGSSNALIMRRDYIPS